MALAGALSVTGAFNWVTGSLNGPAQQQLGAGATTTISGAGSKVQRTHTKNNAVG